MSAPAARDTFSPLHDKIESTRLILADSIAVALENTDRMEQIESQSAELEVTAGKFRRETRDLQRKMCCKAVMMKVVFGSAIMLTLGAIAGILYGVIATQSS